MGYVIAAYTIVVSCLVGYGLRINYQRRLLARQRPPSPDGDVGLGNES